MNDSASASAANNTTPAYYLSGIQYSRLYALAYLDDNLRNGPYNQDQAYERYMEDALKWVQTFDADHLYKELETIYGYTVPVEMADIPQLDFFWKRQCHFIQKMNPKQSFMHAFEENPLWAAVNSVVYTLAILEFDKRVRAETGQGFISQENLTEQNLADMFKRLALNMLFVRAVQIDPPPSAMTGYDIGTIETIVNTKNSKAITLPSNATCC